MHIGIPQGILLSLYLLGLGIALAKHGQEKDEKHNFLLSLAITVLQVALLWWGGFFTKEG